MEVQIFFDLYMITKAVSSKIKALTQVFLFLLKFHVVFLHHMNLLQPDFFRQVINMLTIVFEKVGRLPKKKWSKNQTP